MQLITPSRLRAYRTCPRKHHYAYDLQRRPRVTTPQLYFGTLLHVGLEHWWKSYIAPCESPLDNALSSMARFFAKNSESSERVMDAFIFAQATELMRGYHYRWCETMAERRVLAVEAVYTTPLRNPDTGRKSRSYALAGRIDAIFEQNGNVFLVEHKTTSQDLEGPTYWQRLRMDDQISHYVQGAASLGYDVLACMYDVLKKPQLRPKKKTESLKLNKDGSPRAGQQLEDETPDEYGARVREAIAQAPNSYYQRVDIYRLDDDITRAQRDIWGTAQAMRAVGSDAARSPDACWQYNTRCAYFDVCVGEERIGNDVVFETRDRHEELL